MMRNGNNDDVDVIVGSTSAESIVKYHQSDVAAKRRLLADESAQFSLDDEPVSIPKTKVLVPLDRMLVPAKRPSDQPLVKYDIDSDDDEEGSKLILPTISSTSSITNGGKLVKETSKLTDEFDIDDENAIDGGGDSTGDELDLIPPSSSSRRSAASWLCCNTRHPLSSSSCSIQ